MAAERKRKEKKSVYEGNVYIQATFNNTIVTITDLRGNAIAWASSGGLNFRGAKKSTPFAAQSVAETAVQRAASYGLREVHVFVKGPGIGRENNPRFGYFGTEGKINFRYYAHPSQWMPPAQDTPHVSRYGV